MTRRLFVAAWLSAAAREEVAGIVERLRSTDTDVRWTPKANLHVTLKFLGDVSEERVAPLASALAAAVAGRESFEVALEGLGTFPPKGRPKVVWAGLGSGAREIASLASLTEKALLAEGFLDRPDERPFRAHVTLGRVRTSRGVGRLTDLLEEQSFSGRPQLLEEVTLAESRLSPRGAKYVAVARFPLRGSAAGSNLHHGGETP